MSLNGRSSQQAPPSAKKQRSISSFFTSKPADPINPPTSDTLTELEIPNGADFEKENAGQPVGHRLPSRGLPKSTSKRRSGGDENDDQQSLEGDELAKRSSKRRRTDTEHLSKSSTKPYSSTSDSSPIRSGTSRYIFQASSQARDEAPETPQTNAEDENVDKRRELEDLHQRFVKKLGRPDSFIELKRRRYQGRDEDVGGVEGTENADGEDDDDQDEDLRDGSSAKKGPKQSGGKRANRKLTPLELQVLDIKRKHMDTLLVVEVGYKFRFFGEDARIAAKELSIVCIPGKFRYDEHFSEAHLDRFASASIPVHRLHVHVKRLVSAGHKVGVVRQLETAALKAAGDNRNAPFVRKLTNLYTKGTYIDDAEGLGGPTEGPSGGAPATGYLLCITESNAKGWGTDEKVHVGIVAVQPATGDVIYDDFEDGFMRSEIETRLLHVSPCEFLIVGELSKTTEKLIEHLSGSSTSVFGSKIRVERVKKDKTMAAQAYSAVSQFYANKMKLSPNGEDNNSAALLDKVLKLSEHVTCCLSAMIDHLRDYGLEHVFDLTKYFESFSARSHMLLNGNTLTSLEIYRNQTDYSEKGSLFWALDRTQTRSGQRLLRKWVGRPLLDKVRLQERIAAVEELKDGAPHLMTAKIKSLLSKVKTDLEKSLIRIYYGKCTRPELLTALQALQRIGSEFAMVKGPADAGFQSEMLNSAVSSLPTILDDVVSFLERINPEAAKSDDKYAFFRENEETDEIAEHKLGIASVEHELDTHLSVAAEKVRKKKVQYVTVAGIEYLIEIENTQIKNVPASWSKISGTKKVSRFHTPEVVRLIRERDQHKEALAAACDIAFSALLASISAKYQSLRDCIQSLSTLDCLLSLAAVASQPGYVKPEYADETCISVSQGRHPMVEQSLLDAYVPNDIDLCTSQSPSSLASNCDETEDGCGNAATRALLITGPNMGGKSSYVRQVALICITGQIGSYVPAARARLGMLDAVFTRMGAFDNMMAGESTFMVELSETSDILKQATPRSLVILDELGRGTSTHDGVAIAHAVLDHLVRQTRCLTLFITHYQTLSALAKAYSTENQPDRRQHVQQPLKNVHMRFAERGPGGQDITFLYEIGEGVAHRSYGLNVARLAQIPQAVLDQAAVKSKELEDDVRRKKMSSIAKTLTSVISRQRRVEANDEDDNSAELDRLVESIEQL
ncbi:MAG: Mismatch repair protein msh3 [Sarcosagium campestre]|nr:MAG: Mismatch repair protein msh3 [Sarcosagium campestre]